MSAPSPPRQAVLSDAVSLPLSRWQALIRYSRFRLFQRLLRPFQTWARGRRMELMQTLLDVRRSNSVLDLGGQPGTWDHPSLPPLSVTLVNLPGVVQPSPSGPHTFQYIEGDACDVGYLEDRSYDLVFSNSVIEHVGKPERQTQFADQIRRLGKSYWVQTPSPWFPVEAHTGVPFWWLYPAFLRRSILRRWRRKLPAWTDMIEGTTVLRKKTLQRLFPEATIVVERMFALPKSYIAVKSNPAGATPCRPHPPSASRR